MEKVVFRISLYIETVPLMYSENQCTGFYIIATLA